MVHLETICISTVSRSTMYNEFVNDETFAKACPPLNNYLNRIAVVLLFVIVVVIFIVILFAIAVVPHAIVDVTLLRGGLPHDLPRGARVHPGDPGDLLRRRARAVLVRQQLADGLHPALRAGADLEERR